MMRLMLGALLLLGLIAIAEVRADDLPKVTLYRNSNCGCCLEYARYLRRRPSTARPDFQTNAGMLGSHQLAAAQ